jgi:hypothetical protein
MLKWTPCSRSRRRTGQVRAKVGKARTKRYLETLRVLRDVDDGLAFCRNRIDGNNEVRWLSETSQLRIRLTDRLALQRMDERDVPHRGTQQKFMPLRTRTANSGAPSFGAGSSFRFETASRSKEQPDVALWPAG